MRDPAHIPMVLDALKLYWERHPDMRLGQIVSNMASRQKVMDPFYLEDIRLLGQLLLSVNDD